MTELAWIEHCTDYYMQWYKEHWYTEYHLPLNNDMFLVKIEDKTYNKSDYYLDWGKSGYYCQTSSEEPVRDHLCTIHNNKSDETQLLKLLQAQVNELLRASANLQFVVDNKIL